MHTSIGIVDAEPESLDALSHAFLAAGYDVDGASSFADATRLIETRHRAVLVVTVELGAYNGLHVMLRCLAIHPRTKVLVVGPDSAGLRNQALTLGASAYFARPVAPESLVGRVNDLFGFRPRLHMVVDSRSTRRPGPASDGDQWPSLVTQRPAEELARDGGFLHHVVDVKR